MTAPMIALCIPAYNAAQYLPRLLQSAQAQTIAFDEIWVYDDCSTDRTGEVARQYGAKVIRGSVNLGCSVGKNILAQKTQCEWIHFHDADDALCSNFVECAHYWVSLAKPPDVVLFDYEMRDDDTDSFRGIRHFDHDALQNDPIAYAIREQINPFCGLYRRSAYLQVGGYDTDPLVLYNEDVAFHIRIAIAGLTFAAESNITIINYCRQNSMSSANRMKCVRSHLEVLRKTAAVVDVKYGEILGIKLWGLTGVAAAYQDWETVDSAIQLAHTLQVKPPLSLNLLWRILFQINPYYGVRLREKLISSIKLRLRR